jgi:hypothetical protein
MPAGPMGLEPAAEFNDGSIAGALGLTIPEKMLMLADEVIE